MKSKIYKYISIKIVLIFFLAFCYFWAITPSASVTKELNKKVSVTVDLDESGAVSRGNHLFEYSTNTPLNKISPYLIDAIVASEDRRFRSRNVLYLPARFLQASVECAYRKVKYKAANLALDSVVSIGDFIGITKAPDTVPRLRCAGYSTITQQLTKMLWVREERTVFRKIKELVWAMKLEMTLSKVDILELYVNRVYFGEAAFGPELASRILFGRSADQLSLSESALIAVSIKRPSRNMLANPTAAVADANKILEQMHKQGLTSRLVKVDITKVKFRGNEKYEKLYLEHIWHWTKPSLEIQLANVPAGKYKIFLTIEADVQLNAQAAVDSQIQQYFDAGISASQAAVVVQKTNGAVTAMVGGAGTSARSRSNNRAVSRSGFSCRPPASTLKPVVYLQAIENGFTSNSKVYAGPYYYGFDNQRQIKNYNDEYFTGDITFEYALSASVNTAAVHLFDRLGGFNAWQNIGHRMGLPTKEMADEIGNVIGQSPVCLIDMTSAYALIANGGRSVMPTGVLMVVDKNGRSVGSSIYQGLPALGRFHQVYLQHSDDGKRMFKQNHIEQLQSMLHAVVEQGTGQAARIGIEESIAVAGKTGTTDDNKDAWFIGYSGENVIGVWVGNDIPKSMAPAPGERGDPLTGGTAAAPVFNEILSGLIGGAATYALFM